jgi:hypothetical protein
VVIRDDDLGPINVVKHIAGNELGAFVSHRVSFAFEGRADHRQITRAVRGSFFRGLKTSPADAVALSLALDALTAGKAFFEVATNYALARADANARLGPAIFLCS